MKEGMRSHVTRAPLKRPTRLPTPIASGQRSVDRDAEHDPHDGERIGAEAVHRAEGQIDLADHDHQGQPERHDRHRAHRAQHRNADIDVERIRLQNEHEKRDEDDGEDQASHAQRKVERRLHRLRKALSGMLRPGQGRGSRRWSLSYAAMLSRRKGPGWAWPRTLQIISARGCGRARRAPPPPDPSSPATASACWAG